jgi:high affinity sulfate transporter 1
VFPVIGWLAAYSPQWLAKDAIAGVTLAAYAIPVSMAYASLAGLPPQHGAYCYLVGGVAYAAFGTSRQLAVGPTSAIAMLVGTTIAGMADGNQNRWIGIAALTALEVGVLGVIAWCLRLSGLVSFISNTILSGFKTGAALTIALTQLPKLFGVPGGGDNFFERAWILASQLGGTNYVELALGAAAILVLFLGEGLLPGRPVALVVVALSIVLVSMAGLDQQGLSILGPLPPRLPRLSWPALGFRDVDGVLTLAAACFLLGYVESISAARALSAKNGYEVNPRQELLALGAANLAAALAQGFPVAGGLSQSAVNDKAGARTPLSLVFASATIAFCLLYLTGLLHNLPNVILAAIVLVAVRGLIDVAALRHLWRVSKLEFSVAMFALVGVLVFGILKGVLLAVIASILMLVTAVARTNVAVLGRIPGTQRFSDLNRHPDNEAIPGVLILRIEASLLYFNVDHVRNLMRAFVAAADAPRLVVCDLSNSPYVDTAGAHMLKTLNEELSRHDTRLRVVDAHAKVRDLLRAEGLESQIGYLGRHITIEQAVAESMGPPSPAMQGSHS